MIFYNIRYYKQDYPDREHFLYIVRFTNANTNKTDYEIHIAEKRLASKFNIKNFIRLKEEMYLPYGVELILKDL